IYTRPSRCADFSGATAGSSNTSQSIHTLVSSTSCIAASELLVTVQVTPLSGRQLAERHAADAHAFQAGHVQAHEFAHAPDLALLALAQHEPQLIAVLPGDLGGLERYVIQAQAVIQQLQPLVVEAAFDPYQIFLLDRRILADQHLGDASVLGKTQKPRRGAVKPPGRRQSLERIAFES